MTEKPAGNRLKGSASPYLRQHSTDPVAWWPWCDDAFAAAKAGNKPILLSIGYSACHWCHVMGQESFANPEIAAAINKDYIAIKVDREERPDLDAAYQAACSGLGLAGGWPLTLFLTPDALPFWGGTYFPPTDRGEQPGLKSILSHLAEGYANRPEDVAQNAGTLKAHITEALSKTQPSDLDPNLVDQVAVSYMARMDLEHGGITGTPKFPNTPYFERLWRAYLRTGRADFAAATQLTYSKMCQGGLYDHIGGGFARYSTDAQWHMPHFEKMLYDNALILNALCYLHGNVPQGLYAQRIAQTVDFLLHDMRLASGALAAAMSADDADGEGAFYLWTRNEIVELLGDRLGARVCEAYAIDGETILNIPSRHKKPDLGTPEEEAPLIAACEKLRQHRENRPRPQRDDKVLTDWNGLAIIAITRAAKLMQRDDWLKAARDMYSAVTLANYRHETLHHSALGESVSTGSFVEDYAALGLAGLELACAEDDPGYLSFITYLADEMLAQFQSETGAFYHSRKDAATPFGRTLLIHDQPVPSPNALAVAFLAKLGQLLGTPRYTDAALEAMTSLGGSLKTGFMGMSALLNAFEDLIDPIDVSWAPADYDSETIAWAVAPPGALILGPKMRAVQNGPLAESFAGHKGIMICRDHSCGLAEKTREGAIEALRNARRIATDDAGASIS